MILGDRLVERPSLRKHDREIVVTLGERRIHSQRLAQRLLGLGEAPLDDERHALAEHLVRLVEHRIRACASAGVHESPPPPAANL